MSRIVLRAAAVGTAFLFVVIGASPAWAHEQRQVGAYQLTVGWMHEPTYVGQLNAIQLFVKDAKGGPVDLGDTPTLKVTASTGSKTSDQLELKASFDPDTGLGTRGEYDAAIMPTTSGTYTFHFTGTINDQNVDEKFTSSDKTFDNVDDPTAIEFPNQDPTVGDLATNVNRLNPRVDSAVSAGKSAHDKANSATTLAVVALVVGIVLGGAGVGVGIAGRRRPA